jgi:hypothetical protein
VNSQKQEIASQFSALFGDQAAARECLDLLSSLSQEGLPRVPNYLADLINANALDLFTNAEKLGLFHRVGESKYGVDGNVWGVNQRVLELAQAAFASN